MEAKNEKQLSDARRRDGQSTVRQKEAVQNTGAPKKLIFRIVDSPMGIGKSSSLLTQVRYNVAYREDSFVESLKRTGFFNFLEHERFIIFVSTVKERDERFLRELKAKRPEQPPYNQSILELIRKGENIVTTQSLYGFFNEDTIRAFRQSKYPYTAYFDEIPPLFRDVVGSKQKKDGGAIARFGPADVLLMQQDGIVTKQGNRLVYNAQSEYDRHSSSHKVFDAVKNLSRNCDLYPYGEKDGRFTSIIAFLKRELFECFSQCWFFSYLTKDSMLSRYCAMNHIVMEYYHVEDGLIRRNPDGKYQESYPQGIERLEILEDPRFNMEASLSKEWFKAARNGKNGEGLKKLQGCFRSAYTFMKQQGVRSNTFMFTTFTAYKNLLESDGRHFPTVKRFLPCNAKATNDYSNCTGVAYLCNRFFDVNCVNFLAQQAKEKNNPQLKFDNDNYALSELLQFIWRSNVRVADSDKPVYVWVPNSRMRKLLRDFQAKALEHLAREREEAEEQQADDTVAEQERALRRAERRKLRLAEGMANSVQGREESGMEEAAIVEGLRHPNDD